MTHKEKFFDVVMDDGCNDATTADMYLVPHLSTNYLNRCLDQVGFHDERRDPRKWRFCKMQTLAYFCDDVLIPLLSHRAGMWASSSKRHIFVFTSDFAIGIFGNYAKAFSAVSNEPHGESNEPLGETLERTDIQQLGQFASQAKALHGNDFERDVYAWNSYTKALRTVHRLLQDSIHLSILCLDDAQGISEEYQYYWNAQRNICIPPFVAEKAFSEYRALADQLFVVAGHEPTIFGHFRGAIHVSEARYSHGVRQALLDLPSPRYLIQDVHGPEYVLEMGHARFCLCPGGWAPWSPRWIQALLMGCVPVILADELRIPSASSLNVEDCMLRVSQSISMQNLDATLRKVSLDHISNMRVTGDQLVKQFLWSKQALEVLHSNLINRIPPFQK